MLSLSVLGQIISDTAPASTTLQRVGIVGSYATGTHTETSDVDLVFDTGSKLIDEAIMSTGIQIKAILGNQFNKAVDIINYNTIIIKCENNACIHNLELFGYKHMLDCLRWVWRRTT